jgi:hypothetical protein
MALSVLYGVPYIFTVAGFASLPFIGHLAVFDEELPGGWSNLDGSNPVPWSRLAAKGGIALVFIVVATIPEIRQFGS